MARHKDSIGKPLPKYFNKKLVVIDYSPHRLEITKEMNRENGKSDDKKALEFRAYMDSLESG